MRIVEIITRIFGYIVESEVLIAVQNFAAISKGAVAIDGATIRGEQQDARVAENDAVIFQFYA